MLGNKSIIIIFSNILYTIDFKDFIYKHFFIKFIWKIFFLKILIDMNKHNKYNVLFFVKSFYKCHRSKYFLLRNKEFNREGNEY